MSAIFGERLTFGQHNGPVLELRVYGDEFYARYETVSGYTVVYDVDRGQYCYAVLQNGLFVSSGAPMSKPVPLGIRRHLKEDRLAHNTRFKDRFDLLRPREKPVSSSSNVMRTRGRNSGLLEGRQVAHGDVRGLTILVEFKDVHTNITAHDVDALLNDQHFNANGNFCSVRSYYELMSQGKLNYTNKVVGPVRLSRKQSYYINNLLVDEALEIAINDFNLDLSDFDSLGEGYVDALSFMYAGRTLYVGDLWPHNSIVQIVHGNVRTHFYTIQSLGRHRIDLSIGTFAHETGHMLCRFPDLYDYGEREGDFEQSSGLGRYCLMSSGNHLNGGKTPSPICMYLRDLVGWCDRQISLNNPSKFEAMHADYQTAMRLTTDKPHEYFLVENRYRKDLDEFLPDSGLAVYHCDTRGSNEYQDGTPDRHYQCALIQADGRFDLEKTTIAGDDGDLFKSIATTALSHETIPDSREWDGTDSGLTISQIGPPGDNIPFCIGDDIPANTVSGGVIADLIIPDDDPAGVRSPIKIAQAGTLVAVKVNVKISHTYRGDLDIRLEAPSGKSINLHSGQGGNLDNLTLCLNSSDFAPLAGLRGESVNGDWTLHVRDLLKDDVGRLDSWDITIEYKPAEKISRAEVCPGKVIPDDDVQGLRSTIHIPDSGKVKGLSVLVEVTHSYRGDLQIELICPSGQRALLRSCDGSSADNLQETYTDASTPSLKALIGEDTKGDWILHIRDLALYDTGTLDRWAITIRR